MNDDLPGPANQPGSLNGATDPEQMERFEALIKSWAEATTADRTEVADNLALQLLSMAAEEAIKNPTPSTLFHEEAESLECEGNWVEAESVRRRILSLDETLDSLGLLAKAQMDLASLLRLVGQFDEARQFAQSATASARRMEMFPVLVMALECESWCCLEQQDFPAALALASEAFQVIEPDKVYDQMRAKALTLRARCLLACDELASAESDLAVSWELLKAHRATQALPGPIAALANWWEVKGQLEQRRGSLESAQLAMVRAVEYRRKLEGPYALCALARVLNQLGEISRAAGDLTAAEQATGEAKAIRNRLDLPPKP